MLVYLTENPYITRSKYVELCVGIFGGLFFLYKRLSSNTSAGKLGKKSRPQKVK